MTNLKTGLTTKELAANSRDYGFNALPEVKPPSKLSLLIRQFANPLVYILAAAAGITLLLGDVPEFIGIILVVLINGALGFFQENKAEATLATLTSALRPYANVLRDQKVERVLSKELTVGDVVLLKIGDKVPADGILFNGSDVSVTEAVLTGESAPVVKTVIKPEQLEQAYSELRNSAEGRLDEFEDSTLYMGTSMISGVGKMLVVNIGTETKFGQIAGSVLTQEQELTPLQTRLNQLSTTITIGILFVTIGMFLYGLATGLEFSEILELSIALAVASIPEGLVVALTVILALGMSRIYKRKAIVRKLLSAETLGSVDTICIDKTGTLTEGKMRVVQTFFTDEEIAKRALIANNHRVNALETALSEWQKSNVKASELATYKEEEYIDYKIFDSKTKFSATLGSDHLYIVGAPEKLLNSTDLADDQKQKWFNELEKLTKKGLRIVAAAYKDSQDAKLPTSDLPNDLKWLGLVVVDDPIRPNLAKVFEQANTAGITVKVITGDFGETAKAVMAKIGIDLTESEMIAGADLANLSEEELNDKISHLKLFYRTTPDQKLRIVESLQDAGHTVAMMGDGINDTPALKKAQIGIVVNNATDFSKETADMVLLDSNFRTIIAAVEEGRNIFENMRKVIAYLLSDALDEIIIIGGAIVLGVPSPLLPLQILYINFVTDSLPDLGLTFEQPEHELMLAKPKPKNYPLLDAEVRSMIVAIGVVVSAFLLGIYLYMLNNTEYEIEFLQTIIFVLLGVNSLFYVFSVRSFRKPIWRQNLFTNRILLLGSLGGFVSILLAVYFEPLQQLLHTVAMPAWVWILVAVNTFVNITIIELIKHHFLAKQN